MLTRENNEMLTRVGPGTPMGDLFRRFWFPILLADELPEPDCQPKRVKAFGEFFVAFRDSDGNLGLLDARCPHRGIDLSLGFAEERGLRCVQCFWKFDVRGKVMDLPLEPEDSPLWQEANAPAFQIREYGGLIWAYIGPQDDIPDLPEFEWTRVTPEQRHLSRFLVECNFMQGVEGGLDAGRVEALRKAGLLTDGDPLGEQVEHRVQAKQTDYGLLVGTALGEEDAPTEEVQVTHWLMPFYTTAPADENGVFDAVAWVPVDDESTIAFAVTYDPKGALAEDVRQEIRDGKRVHPQLAEGGVRRKRNKENAYVEDGKQRPSDFASRFDNQFEMIIACQESMGTIVDRTQEHLGDNDAAVTAARQKLLDAAVDLMEGSVPVVVHKGEAYRVRSYAARLEREADLEADERVRKGIAAEV